MPTNLFLVRHAHSIYTPDERERPLSERGKTDTKKVTELFKNENIDIIISSPYNRASQTVEGIALIKVKKMLFEEDLRERLLSTKPVEDFHSAITKVWEDFDFAWLDGESSRVAQNRGVAAITNILRKHREKNIVVGTHGNLMGLIMNHFDPKYDFKFWQNLDMPDIYKLTFEGEQLMEVNRIWNRN